MRTISLHVFTALIFASCGLMAANESPQSFTLDGTLLAADHVSPLRDATAKVRVQILNPSKTCVLYDEEQTVNTMSSDGHFNIQVGSAVGASKRRALDSANAMALVYQNASSIPAQAVPLQTCAGSSYLPAAGDVRYVRVIVTPTSAAAETLSPDMVLDSVPSALVAQSLQGLEKSGFIQVNPAALLTQAKLEQFIQALTAVPGMGVSYDGTNFTSYDPKNGGLLASGSVTDTQISDVEWSKVTSVPPAIAAVAGLACTNGEILKFVSGSWACGTESGVGVESDPTVSVFAKHAPGAGLVVNGSNQLVPDFGTTAGKVAQGNDSRFTDSRAPNGSASGDLSGSYPNPTVAKIQGRGVSVTAPADGQVLKYDNGTSTWVPSNFGIADLKKSNGLSQFVSASCTSSQTLIWSSITDDFSCTNISLPVAQVTGTLPVANGGTGATTFASNGVLVGNATSAVTTITPTASAVLLSNGSNVPGWSQGTNNRVLRSNGSAVSWSQVGLTTDVTGALPIANGGTGATTANAAFNALAPAQTSQSGKFLTTNGTDTSWTTALTSESDPKVGANTANYLSKWDGSALVASGVYETGGSVGIGTSSPTRRLHAYSNNGNTSTSSFLIEQSGIGNAWMNFWQTGGVSYALGIDHIDLDKFKIGYAATAPNGFTSGTRLTIDTSGNIGIGTTNPGSILEISATTPELTIVGSSTGYHNGAVVLKATNASGNVRGLGTYMYDSVGQTEWFAGRPYGTGGGSDQFIIGRLASVVAHDQTTAVYSNALMTVRSSGNVGIGTTSPATKLQIVDGTIQSASTTTWPIVQASSSNTTYQPHFIMSQNNAGAHLGAGYPMGIVDFRGNTSNTSARIVAYASENHSASALGGILTFSTTATGTTTSTERLRIDGSGRVGIGTTNPSYNLHVVGTAGLSTSTAWTNASDIRLKDIHGDYEHGLNEVLKLHTVRYNYKKNNALRLPSDFEKTGFIAQEVQEVIPEAVKEREDGYLELNVDPIHWAVVNAVKELYSRWFSDSADKDRKIEELRAEKDREISEIKSENAAIKAYLCMKEPSAPFCK